MFELKPIHRDAIPAALAKAERYRLLNEPRAAESICRDVLRTDPRNQIALVTLLLALTDQFTRRRGPEITSAQEIVQSLESEYERDYYDGVVCERWGKAQLRRNAPSQIGCDWLREAMSRFEKAEAIRPAGNDDAILRWNACARLIMRHEPEGADASGGADGGVFDEDVPLV